MSKEESYIDNDEVTLKDLILKSREYIDELINNWVLLVTLTIPFVLFFAYTAMTTLPVFEAKLTFMVNEENDGGGGVSSILGQFGIGGGGSKANLDKMLKLSTSRRIVEKVLFDKIMLDGKEDFVANHIILIYDYHSEWAEDTTGLKNFLFVRDDYANFSRTENKVLKSIYTKVVGTKKIEPLLTTDYGENTGIMLLNFSSLNESLSIKFCDLLFAYLSDFYVEKTIEKQQQTFDVVKANLDSLETERSKLEYTLANFRDSNRGLYTTKAKLKEMQLQRDVQIVNEAYGVNLKNFEIASFTLKNKTPFIQIIDNPIPPIKPMGTSLLVSIIIGGVIGISLAVLLIFSRKMYRDTMTIEN